MSGNYRVLGAGGPVDLARELAVDVLVGLSERPKRLPSRLFYDEVGSRLFARICDLEEYYLTRAEDEVLRTHAAGLLPFLGERALNLVDLGAGDVLARDEHILVERHPNSTPHGCSRPSAAPSSPMTRGSAARA